MQYLERPVTSPDWKAETSGEWKATTSSDSHPDAGLPHRSRFKVTETFREIYADDPLASQNNLVCRELFRAIGFV